MEVNLVNSLIKKLGLFSIGPIVGAMIGFITIPIITYFISPDEYGKSSMFSLAITILQLFVFLGMDQAYVKKYYEFDNKVQLLTNAILPSIFLVVILDILLFIFKHDFAYLLFDDRHELVCVYALMAILPALAIEKFGLLIIRMEQKGLVYSILTILLKLMILVFTIILLLKYERTFRAIVLGTVIGQIIFSLIIVLFQRNSFRINFKMISHEKIKSLVKFGLPIVPTTIIGWVLSGMDKVMLRAMCNYSELGMYEVAIKIVMALGIVQTCFTNFWIPVAHQWNNENVSKDNFVKVGKLIAFIMTVVFICILLFKEVIFVILSGEYSAGINIIPFLLIYPVMYTISEVTVMGIYFKEKTANLLIVSIVAAITDVFLNLILIPSYGAVGAAIATGCAYAIFFWCRTIISRKLWFKFPLKDYIFVTIILFMLSSFNILLNGLTIYIINILVLLFTLIYFRNEVCVIFNEIGRFIKK